MALDLPLGSLLRVSTGVLLGALGVLILVMRPAEPRARWLALWFIALTPVSIAIIWVRTGDGSLRGPAAIAAAIAMLVGVVALALHLRIDAREGGAPARRVIAISLGIGFVAAACMLPGATRAEMALEVFAMADALARALLGGVALLYARRAQASMDGSTTAAGSAWLALGLSLFPVASPSLDTAEVARSNETFAFVGLALPTLLFAATAVELARLGTRARPVALVGALAIPGIGVAALAVGAFVDTDFGQRGIVRGIALPILAYAIFRYDLLRSARHPRWATPAAVAPSLLAVLFITAQVAQNFLSAEYGLLMGGVVAGALLLAARPIERALERRARVPADDDDKLAVYRDAARRSLRDGIVTREEEMHLARLARHLAIPADVALRIRHEVEDERRPAEAAR